MKATPQLEVVGSTRLRVGYSLLSFPFHFLLFYLSPSILPLLLINHIRVKIRFLNSALTLDSLLCSVCNRLTPHT